jgi:hypothetical protein
MVFINAQEVHHRPCQEEQGAGREKQKAYAFPHVGFSMGG